MKVDLIPYILTACSTIAVSVIVYQVKKLLEKIEKINSIETQVLLIHKALSGIEKSIEKIEGHHEKTIERLALIEKQEATQWKYIDELKKSYAS